MGDSADFTAGSRLDKYDIFNTNKIEGQINQFLDFNSVRYKNTYKIRTKLKKHFLNVKKTQDIQGTNLLEYMDWVNRQGKLFHMSPHTLQKYKLKKNYSIL